MALLADQPDTDNSPARPPVHEPESERAGYAFIPPPPAGSDDEMLATALAVGYPGAFGLTSGQVERQIRLRLLWES
jgi:hypothetical protein